MDLHASNLQRLDDGARLLGSGGGAPSVLALRLTAKAWPSTASVPVIPFESVPEESWIFSAAIVGAGSMYDERPPGGTEFEQAFDYLVRRENLPISALLCAEIGGMNGLFIVDAARKSGFPLIDADLMGRALPRMGQFSLAVSGHRITPAVVVLPGGETILIDRAANESVERIVRTLLGATHGWACIGFPPIPASQLRATVIHGSISRALDLGAWLEACAAAPQGQWPQPPDGEFLGEGRVVDVSRGMPESPAEFASTSILCSGGEILRVDSLSEFLLVLKDGSALARTPDIIVLVDRVSCRPIVCGDLRVGAEVVAIRLQAPEFWRDPRHAPAVDLAAFGLADPADTLP